MKSWSRFLLLALFVALTTVGCNGKITDDDLELWSNSPAGWEKIAEVVEDKDVPVATKVKALDILIMKGNTSKVKDILYQSAFRQEIAVGVKDVLTKRFPTAKDDDKSMTKDGIMMVLRYFPAEEQAPLQKMIADWAFGGLTDKDNTEAVKAQIEKRIMLAQVPDLGPAGIDGAALLLSRGFGVDRMYRFIRKFEKTEYDDRALEAFKKLHKIPNIEISPNHLQMIADMMTSRAVAYLIDIFYMDDQDASVREDALALAVGMFSVDPDDSPKVKKAKEAILSHKQDLLPVLQRIMKEPSAENRRLAAHYILQFGGAGELKGIMEALKDDQVMNVSAIDMQPFMRDFCVDDILSLPEASWAPIMSETAEKSDNRLIRSLAIVCLKMTTKEAYAPLFKRLSKDSTEIPDIIGPEMTIGRLAANALTAVDRIKGLKAKVAAGAISKEDAELRTALYLGNLEFSDSVLDEFVQIKFNVEKRRNGK